MLYLIAIFLTVFETVLNCSINLRWTCNSLYIFGAIDFGDDLKMERKCISGVSLFLLPKWQLIL